MGSREIIGGVLCLGLCATVGFAACRGPQPGPPPPTTATPTGQPQPIASVTPPPSATVAPAPVDTVAVGVSAARACTAPTSRIANRPDGGLVFVNAWRRQDAGNIDRLQGVVEAISASDTAFRCCFDVWQREHPAEEGKLMLEMELTPEGKVDRAEIDAERSSVDDVVTRRCVVEVARSLTYPPSPSDRTTLVEYPFVIAAE